MIAFHAITSFSNADLAQRLISFRPLIDKHTPFYQSMLMVTVFTCRADLMSVTTRIRCLADISAVFADAFSWSPNFGFDAGRSIYRNTAAKVPSFYFRYHAALLRRDLRLR